MLSIVVTVQYVLGILKAKTGERQINNLRFADNDKLCTQSKAELLECEKMVRFPTKIIIIDQVGTNYCSWNCSVQVRDTYVQQKKLGGLVRDICHMKRSCHKQVRQTDVAKALVFLILFLVQLKQKASVLRMPSSSYTKEFCNSCTL